jgi:hypothetical protein
LKRKKDEVTFEIEKDVTNKKRKANKNNNSNHNNTNVNERPIVNRPINIIKTRHKDNSYVFKVDDDDYEEDEIYR